ncbi:hypothetical protein, partial [Candidatus Symbiothrix dinenymphae]|uniref:hypothetical protein n=1 Tax=Candidatus Symbiothrix dinenymphae TaxID=467085 RepID=UPI000A8F3D7F
SFKHSLISLFSSFSFALKIKNYYDGGKGSDRFYGLTFEVKSVCFKIEIDREFYYGFRRAKEKEENKEISECLNEIGGFGHCTKWWFGRKLPSPEYCLNFESLNSEGFNKLKDPRQRERFIEGLAEEIDTCIKKFQKIAERNNL